jgi:hypothetical protein
MRLPAKVPSQRVHLLAIPQAEVAQALLALVTARGVQLDEQAIVVAALEHARDLKDIDFVDAYVAAKAAGDGLAVASFDGALHKKLGTTFFPLQKSSTLDPARGLVARTTAFIFADLASPRSNSQNATDF